MGGFGMPGAPGDFLFGPALHMSGVELSDAQVETITKVRKASQKQRDQIHSTLHSLDDSLRDELYADNIDAAKVKKLQAEIGSARAQLASIGDDEQLQTMQSLTAEQRHSIRMAIARMSLGPAGLKHHEHEKKD
jgi:Spy/CpxP family protein refolding chaperone